MNFSVSFSCAYLKKKKKKEKKFKKKEAISLLNNAHSICWDFIVSFITLELQFYNQICILEMMHVHLLGIHFFCSLDLIDNV